MASLSANGKSDHHETSQSSCSQCGQTLHMDQMEEHADWHFARDLQSREQPGYSSAVPASLATPQHSMAESSGLDDKRSHEYAPPSGPPPSSAPSDSKQDRELKQPTAQAQKQSSISVPPSYAAPSYPPPAANGTTKVATYTHENQVTRAAEARAKDEQEMQNMLQNVQFQYGIYNSEIEPEHEAEYWCACAIHQYQRAKWYRYRVQDLWSKAVMYPGEKAYNDNKQTVFGNNPYRFRVVSPYGYGQGAFNITQRPQPRYHALSIHQTIDLNNSLNRKAQAAIDEKESKIDIWDEGALNAAMSQLAVAAANNDKKGRIPTLNEQVSDRKGSTQDGSSTSVPPEKPKSSKFSSFRKSLGIKSSDERAVGKVHKQVSKGQDIRDAILAEEAGRWPDEQWRYIVAVYQDKVGMTRKIADLRARQPIQYLHLLRAGYFEPIPVAWADQASNPLKFSIEAAAGWRGVTPAWRGYEDTAEERLYWVLNHREGTGTGTAGGGARMKPDFISAMDMARARMATAVEPPPQYFAADDTCHVQHTSAGYSKQVMPPPFRAYDRPETPSDDTMILLDVSGSMDFDPLRPNYEQYLITGYSRSTQPKNKDVAKAIVRRFTEAMAHHDQSFAGYDLLTFSTHARHIGTINHANFEATWRAGVRLGGGTRVMTGWQKAKELHFAKHSASAVHHPVLGWQAGPATPMLRLLLLLDGEATDMDEFELDLLGLSWAHVTVFLVGVEGCPHHHRHANELQRIGDANPHVSFVDVQGNAPERYVTHELLKRHLGYDMSMEEFVQTEQLPAYSEEAPPPGRSLPVGP